MVFSAPQDAFDAALNFVIVGLALAAIALLGASVPWLCLTAVIVAGVAREHKGTIPYMAVWAIIVLTMAAMFKDLILNYEFGNDSGRFLVWNICIDHWLAAPLTTKLFGFGLGSVQTLLLKWFPAYRHDWWIFAHNSWLQCLLELGLVGLASVLYVAASAFRIAWRTSTRTTASLAGIAVFGFFNYPANQAFVALFCACVVLGLFRQDYNKTECDRINL
jgi:O-antigen ligase